MEKQHKVQCYAAPLEGITGYIYRNAHQHIFQGVDKYFTPFVTPKPKKGLNTDCQDCPELMQTKISM